MGAAGELSETALVFRAEAAERAGLEVRVNFGVFAGRNATQAEIEDLARSLRELASSFAVVAEDRHEFGGASETAVRQIVIQVDDDDLSDSVFELAEEWATRCIRSRSDLGELGSDL